jgi:guanosine-3',5'-bis(diphosphate) 3'-pyrophosphohydrolase
MAAVDPAHRLLLEAVGFAARAHRGQVRKDGATPYVSHVFRVCLVLRQVFGIDDSRTLTAAILHDTIEDTKTDFDDVKERFGEEVAGWVAALSKDKRLDEEPREAVYVEQLVNAPWQVKVCKLADIFDNLLDAAHLPPSHREKTLKRSRLYLDALAEHLPDRARKPFQSVSELLREMESGPA